MLHRPCWPALAFLFICLPHLALCQTPVEPAWQVRHNASAKATFVATDQVDDAYVVEQFPNSTAQLNIFDPFGTLLKTYDIAGVVTGLVVDLASGTAAVSVGAAVNVFYWDGFDWSITIDGTPIGLGMDDAGRVIQLFQEPTYTLLWTFGGDESSVSTNVPVVANSSYIDGFGRFALFGGSGTLESSTSFVNFYSESGTLLWSRTFSKSLAGGDSIAGFSEGPDGTGFLAINHLGTINGGSTSIEAINPNNGSSDLWDSAAIAGHTNLISAGGTVYISGQNNGNPFIAAYGEGFSGHTAGAQVWLIQEPATQILPTLVNALVLSYDSTSGKGTIKSYSGDTGAQLSTFPLGIPTAADLGTILTQPNDATLYVGDTGGPASTSIIAGLVSGICLSSVSFPTSVIGGANATFNIVFDANFPGFEPVDLFSSNTAVLSLPKDVIASGSTSSFKNPTLPVDADTVVIMTAQQPLPQVRRLAALTVLTAQLSSFQISVPTLTAPVTANGQITLTGPAGPSGKTITLSSNSPTLTVPAIVTIPPNSTKATFTINSHPVLKDNTVTISATLNGHTLTAKLVVFAPVLSNFTLNPSSVVGGANSTGSATLNGTVENATTLAVSCSNPNVTVPATVTVPAGASSVSFPVKTKAVTTSTTAIIKVSFGTLSVSQTLTMTPQTG